MSLWDYAMLPDQSLSFSLQHITERIFDLDTKKIGFCADEMDLSRRKI